MKKQKDLSAKDKAFMKEKVRLHSIIQDKDAEIVELKAEVAKYKMAAESWEKTAKLLETKIGIQTDKLLADIDRNKRICAMLAPTMSVIKEYIK